VAAGSPETRADVLTDLVREFFETPLPPRWSSDRSREPPDRFVYLLDHEYTQRGLAWNRLKNADAARAAALQDVARRLDCEILLALADVHETWSCEDDDYGYGRHRWAWGYDDEDDDDDESGSSSDENGHELIDLIDGSVELRHWVGPGSRRAEAVAARVDDAEVCYTKPSVDCEPFESEYEGFTGNAGNTVDRWYHRAAVVLWPRERNFVIRAKASPRWAVSEIGKALRAGNTEQALDQTRRVLPFWPQAVARDEKSGLMEKTLRLAVELGDAAVAAELLAPFRLKAVTPKAAPLVASLLDRYGNAWCRKLVLGWTSENEYFELPDETLKWLGSMLPTLCCALCCALCNAAVPDGPTFACWLLENRWAWTEAHINRVQKNAEAREVTKTLARVSVPLLAMIESCGIADDSDLRDRIVAFLIASADDLPVQLPLGLLKAAHRYRRAALPDLGLLPLHEHGARMLATRLADPARAADDWSIGSALRCSCKLCTTLSRFLRAPSESRFEWPLAKEGRRHVHGVIDSRDLPVLHKTRRTGRPFTLVLEKTAAVFERDAAERRLWAGELEWLEQTAGAFGST
jgi:hypothetical protein